MEVDEQAVVVLDIGTHKSKCGFAGDDAPRSVFQTVVGKPRVSGIMIGMDMRDAYVGQEALGMRGLLNMSKPMEDRQTSSWEDISKVWHHAFYNELKVAPEEHTVLLSEPPLNPPQKKEKIMELMFEEFTVKSYYSVIGATLGLFAAGRTIGIVVDSGEGGTHTVPVYEGYSCIHAINKLKFAGGEMTNYLRDLLDERGYSFTTPKEIDIVRDIKEKLCIVGEEMSHEIKAEESHYSSSDVYYELPDNNTILIKGERYKAAEGLFNPGLYGIRDDGIHHKVYQSIMKCDQDIRKELYDHILLVGGTTLVNGLKERLRKDVQSLAPLGTKPVVIDPPEREFSVWVGGSILASLSSFQKMCISKQAYEEQGARIIHIKC
ncbi:hypothetical protein SteCoe_7266 [Stentor coeruleus]|uniref:Uncharacterized protein n=1 Tax=Stentor coeruleus TaxID=5963 RepID=A0A1R2CMV8_9CILI|nr:hypothetical protein SteCoe_7266 [Stentor coeruleus]